MVVRIRLRLRPPPGGRVALATSALLTPGAVMALALGVWRLGSDLSWTGEFAISQGLFSHWQVWIGLALLLQLCASLLDRYGRGGGAVMP